MGKSDDLPDDIKKISGINKPGLWRYRNRFLARRKIRKAKQLTGLNQIRRNVKKDLNQAYGDIEKLVQTNAEVSTQFQEQGLEIAGLQRQYDQSQQRADQAEGKLSQLIEGYHKLEEDLKQYQEAMSERLALAMKGYLLPLMDIEPEEHNIPEIVGQINTGLLKICQSHEQEAERAYAELDRRGKQIFTLEIENLFKTEPRVAKAPVMAFAENVPHYETKRFEKFLRGYGSYRLINEIKADAKTIEILAQGKKVRKDYDDFELVLSSYTSDAEEGGTKAIIAYLIPRSLFKKGKRKFKRRIKKASERAVSRLRYSLDKIGSYLPDLQFAESS
jgi:hypothetical protein